MPPVGPKVPDRRGLPTRVYGAGGRPGGPSVGSSAERLIISVPIPVVVVPARASAPSRIRRVLVPLDGTRTASDALLHAVQGSVQPDVRFIALHVHTGRPCRCSATNRITRSGRGAPNSSGVMRARSRSHHRCGCVSAKPAMRCWLSPRRRESTSSCSGGGRTSQPAERRSCVQRCCARRSRCSGFPGSGRRALNFPQRTPMGPRRAPVRSRRSVWNYSSRRSSSEAGHHRRDRRALPPDLQPRRPRRGWHDGRDDPPVELRDRILRKGAYTKADFATAATCE